MDYVIEDSLLCKRLKDHSLYGSECNKLFYKKKLTYLKAECD